MVAPAGPRIDRPADGEPAAAPVMILDRAPGAARVVFGVAVVAAGAFYLWAGRDQWFFQDDWRFLVGRSLRDPAGLLAPHVDHWVTLPAIVYRLLFEVFGLSTYRPYQALALANHLLIAVLLRVVMRRAGVAPWTATAAAGAVLAYGTGSSNIIWGFQITFAGSISLGLAHLVLADHDGPVGRRDAVGVVCGLAALMCSAVGVVMAAATGAVVLLRRGRRRAALHLGPLVVAQLLWQLTYGREREGGSRPTLSPRPVLDFARVGLQHAAETFTQHRLVLLVGVLVVAAGLVLAVRADGDRRARLAAPVVLAAAAVAFFVVSGVGRVGSFDPSFATRSRYSHLAVALVVPLVALAIDAVARARPRFGPAAVALLLIGVPGNLTAVEVARNDAVTPEVLGALLAVPWVDDVPADHDPFANEVGARAITMGWLRDHGEPLPDDPSPAVRRRAEAMLTTAFEPAPDARGCRPVDGVARRRVPTGGRVVFEGAAILWVTRPDGRPLPVRGHTADEPTSLLVLDGPLEVDVGSFDPDHPVRLCRSR